MDGLHPAVLFYGLQSGLLVLLWLVILVTGGSDLYRHAFRVQVLVRPSWVPRNIFLLLHRRWVYLSICYSLPLLLALAAWQYNSRAVRFLVAIVASLYGLAESSATTSHRDYAMVYNTWALAMLPDSLAQGAALGVCIHFIASSGFAKLIIGGLEWAEPGTISSILQTYGGFPFGDGPASSALCKRVAASPAAARAAALGTLLFECLAVPLALVLPVGQPRLAIAAMMVLVHVGIFFAQSAVVGIFFIPNVASYALGFGANLELGSPGWFCALAVCVAPSACVLMRRRLLPEDWPVTPFALFGWSGPQWEMLHKHLVTGDTRLIISLDRLCGPVGLPVVERTMRGAMEIEAPAVYNAWNVCLGDTTVHNEILEALNFEAMARGSWEASTLTQAVERWLGHGRLVERGSARALQRAYFVRLADDGRVAAILASGAGADLGA